MFPFPFHETTGAPGKGWVAVEIRRIADEVTWVMDGQIIATISADKTLFGGGNVMIGYTDPFSSIANPGEENFVIFDNNSKFGTLIKLKNQYPITEEKHQTCLQTKEDVLILMKLSRKEWQCGLRELA